MHDIFGGLWNAFGNIFYTNDIGGIFGFGWEIENGCLMAGFAYKQKSAKGLWRCERKDLIWETVTIWDELEEAKHWFDRNIIGAPGLMENNVIWYNAKVRKAYDM